MIHDQARVALTPGAKERIEELSRVYADRLLGLAVERARLPGDPTYEITASDIERAEGALESVLPRRRVTRMAVGLYAVLGALAIIAGLLFDELIALAANPARLTLVTLGFSLVMAAIVINWMLEVRLRRTMLDMSQRDFELLTRQYHRLLENYLLAREKGGQPRSEPWQ